MSRNRGRSNGNESGSSKDRRARRAWLVTPEAGFGGDGLKVLCQVCFGLYVTVEDMVVGRITAGVEGGTYRRDNVRPECSGCSCREGQRRATAAKLAKKLGLSCG